MRLTPAMGQAWLAVGLPGWWAGMVAGAAGRAATGLLAGVVGAGAAVMGAGAVVVGAGAVVMGAGAADVGPVGWVGEQAVTPATRAAMKVRCRVVAAGTGQVWCCC